MKRWQRRTEYFDNGYECEIFWRAHSSIRFIRSSALSAWMTSITSLAKFEICRILEHTHNPGKLLQIISLEAYTEHFTIPRLSVDFDFCRIEQYVQLQMYILCSCSVYVILYTFKCMHYLAHQKFGGTQSTFKISQCTKNAKQRKHWYLCKWKLSYDIIIVDQFG